MSVIRRWFTSTIDVRKGEVLITSLMVAYIYLLLVTYYLLKPARDSLFLSNTGPAFLPLVFVLIAVVVVPITTLYSRVSRSLPLNRLINLTTVVIISNLFILRWLLNFEDQDWVFYVFYIWVSIYGALAPSQFWLFANAAYDSTQAKRIFVIFSLAAILGAFTGGGITSLIVTTFGVSTEDLLYFCAGFLTICLPLVNFVWRLQKKAAEEDTAVAAKKRKSRDAESWGQMFADIRKSRHLRLIMGIIAATMATASFVDYQFKFVSTDSYSAYEINSNISQKLVDSHGVPEEVIAKLQPMLSVPFDAQEDFRNRVDDLLTANQSDNYRAVIVKQATTTDKEMLTAFLGSFYGGLSLLGFLFQLLFSYRAMKFFGVGGVILFLPFSQVLASIGMLIAPNITAATLLRGSDGVFKYSIDKTARELLFLPIPLEIKKRSKVFIDLFIDRVFRGISGLVLLFFTLELQLTMRQLSVVILVMVAVWIFLDLRIRREYLNAFRLALDRGQIHPDAVSVRLDDPATVQHVNSALKSGNQRQIRYALNLLHGSTESIFHESLHALLDHSDPAIRGQVIRILHEQNAFGADLIERFRGDRNVEVSTEIIAIEIDTASGPRQDIIERYLDGSAHEQASAIAYMVNSPGQSFANVLTETRVEALLKNAAEDDRILRLQIAAFLGQQSGGHFTAALRSLMNEKDRQIAQTAIVAAGTSRNQKLLPDLFSLLGNRLHRGAARKSLAKFGDDIIPELLLKLNDQELTFDLRRAIPRVLQSIASQAATNELLAIFGKLEPSLNDAVLFSLYQIRSSNSEIVFEEQNILKHLRTQSRDYYCSLHWQEIVGRAGHNSESALLLMQSLQDAAKRSQRNIFRILALVYSFRDMRNAYIGFSSENNTLRANAAEFLENSLHKNIRNYLLPMIEGNDVLAKSAAIFELKFTDLSDAIRAIIAGDNPWLQSCSLFYAGEHLSEALGGEIQAAGRSGNPWVRETAEMVLKRMAQDKQ